MIQEPDGPRPVSRKELLLWSGIAAYIGMIYSTLSVVPAFRKALCERFGYDIFDWIFVLFILAGISLLVFGIRTFRGKALVRYFVVTGIAGTGFTWYLLRLPYAIERIHLFEYGLLGLLLCAAFQRRLHKVAAYGAALVATYCIGLGDEAIQGALASRVGEIRDALTNAVSGFFGIVTCGVSLSRQRQGGSLRIRHLKALLIMCGVAAVGTGAFLVFIQGFGFVIEDGKSRFFSGLSRTHLERIGQTGVFSSTAQEKIFVNEAERHLFQRDFYFTNDFLAGDGSYYRDYWRALGENAILEKWYGPFLKKYRNRPSREFSGTVDRSVGDALGTLPVVWSDSLKDWVVKQAGGEVSSFCSRVKSTVITRFSLGFLLAVEVVFLMLLAIGWVAAARRKTGRF